MLPNQSAPKVEGAPALPPHIIEQQRREAALSKVQVVRERLILNRGAILEGQNPASVYVWINQHPDRLSTFEGLGYQVCKDPKVRTRWKLQDGTHRRGDLVLYQIDRESYDGLKLYSEIQSLEGLRNSKDSFLGFADRRGIPTFQPKV